MGAVDENAPGPPPGTGRVGHERPLRRLHGGTCFARCRRGRPKGGPHEPADHALGRSRGGFSTKLHLTCERHRHVLSIALTAGQASDLVGVFPALEGVRVQGLRGRPRQRPRVLVGDKGYSFGPVRRWARAHHVRAVLPSRSDQPRVNARCRAQFDPSLYRQRNVIERAVGHLKDKRAIGTRYDKLAVNYLAMVQVALICSYLRHLHPSDRA
ncbi:IS5 family transposase [Myxococcus fulvus]|uniref:IS5 family transposase n=1 Tax=Myxococcus fulvus TaxID=33 RepID=UPI003B9ADE29